MTLMASLWDLPLALVGGGPMEPEGKPAPASARLALRPLAPGEWLARETVCYLAGDEARVPYAVVGLMPCGREDTYALLVPYEERAQPETPRQVVPVEQLRVVATSEEAARVADSRGEANLGRRTRRRGTGSAIPAAQRRQRHEDVK